MIDLSVEFYFLRNFSLLVMICYFKESYVQKVPETTFKINIRRKGCIFCCCILLVMSSQLLSLFNVLQITSLQCTKNLGPKMPLSNSVACALRLPCSELQDFRKQHRWIAENDEPRDQCPVQDEFNHRKFDLSILDNKPMPFSSQSGTSSISNHQICGKV